MFGRRSDVFRNQVRVGTLEVSPLHKTSEVRTSIRLEWVRVFPIGTINAFLDGIAIVCDFRPMTKEY